MMSTYHLLSLSYMPGSVFTYFISSSNHRKAV